MSFIVSEITIYPIKSLGGIALQEAFVEARGLQHDRRWVLADENNVFITQRQNEQMALIEVRLSEKGLVVYHRINRIAPLEILFLPETTDNELITIWDDEVRAIRVSDKADAWFSQILGKKCRLFYQPDNSIRLTDPKYAITKTEHTSFADGYPILLVSQASLDALNEQLAEHISMKRFRPNIVFSGGKPHQEDEIREFSIGETKLVGVKPCARCVLTTIDPETAEKGKEPLLTLSKYRNRNNKILFGQNVLVHQTGKIRVGDELRYFR